MLQINKTIQIPDHEIECKFVRSQGAGGQHVNKASTAVHLRFDFLNSPSLPAFYKQRLLKSNDSRISKDGIIVIKAQKFRSQDMNKEDALQRLVDMIRSAGAIRKKRRPTRPTKTSQLKRLEKKTKQARTKHLRKSVRLNNE